MENENSGIEYYSNALNFVEIIGNRISTHIAEREIIEKDKIFSIKHPFMSMDEKIFNTGNDSGNLKDSKIGICSNVTSTGLLATKFKKNQKLLYTFCFRDSLYMPWRGYTIFHNEKMQASEIKVSPKDKRPIWFIFAGLGCQWAGMGEELMEIETFAKSMGKCAKVLKPYGIDLMETISKNSTLMERERKISQPLVAITAIQIALTDVLKELNIVPDGIIGHSTGEVAAGYADGCLTLEEAINLAYIRALANEKADIIQGRMTVVGISWEEAESLCPPSVYPSCNNSDESVVISGPEEDVMQFEEILRKRNIFSAKVNSLGFCFHSKYVEAGANKMKEMAPEILKNPKLRSKKWLSTSFREENWNDPDCKFASLEYFANNFVAPVYFKEATKKIPHNALVVEISPHCNLISVMKKTLSPSSTTIGLMKRNALDSVKFLFQMIGKMYIEGLNLKETCADLPSGKMSF